MLFRLYLQSSGSTCIRSSGIISILMKNPLVIAMNHTTFFFGKLHSRKFIDMIGTISIPSALPLLQERAKKNTDWAITKTITSPAARNKIVLFGLNILIPPLFFILTLSALQLPAIVAMVYHLMSHTAVNTDIFSCDKAGLIRAEK